MKFLRETKKNNFKFQEGILCCNINEETTLKVSEFYNHAPFPNYQGYENKTQNSSH